METKQIERITFNCIKAITINNRYPPNVERKRGFNKDLIAIQNAKTAHQVILKYIK